MHLRKQDVYCDITKQTATNHQIFCVQVLGLFTIQVFHGENLTKILKIQQRAGQGMCNFQ